ncbi:MAG: hypothetical protein QOC96_2126 [Acidobacteriota bacterium]|jgi:hypothetical protein|nr:hypothetical protein [Acidobacteriota bacterium]
MVDDKSNSSETRNNNRSLDNNDKSTGKSFADVFDAVLSDRKKWLPFFLLIIIFFSFFLGLAYLIPKILNRETKSLKFSALGAEFLIESGAGGQTQYLTVVQPQGWQKTGILVKKGQRLSFKAGGRVCIDLEGLIDRAKQLDKFENDYTTSKNINKNSDDPTQRPERYFTGEEVRSLKLDQIWSGPAGFKNGNRDNSFAGRISLRIMPRENLGALIATVQYEDRPPKSEDVFLIGDGIEKAAPADGYIWFNINDVMDKDNDKSIGRPDDPENMLFYFDNVGFFWVQINLVNE